MKLRDIGEFGFIERIRSQVHKGEGVCCGIGDDCAVLDVPPGHRLLTTKDLLIEGIHFRRDLTRPRQLGQKSVAVNISDIAAMGGQPRHLYLGVALPEDITVEELDLFLEGFLQEAHSAGAVLVGGDTCRSPGPLMISVTAEGIVPSSECLHRNGATAGDLIYVSGTLGDSALALDLLLKGQTPSPFLAARHHTPTARTALGRELAVQRIPSAMIDVSDGLLADLGHILKASGVGARIETTAIPLSKEFRRYLQEDSAVFDLALGGGEDYELLFTLPPVCEAALQNLAGPQLSFTRIGTITPPDDGLQLIDSKGQPYSCRHLGFNHFTN